MIRRLSFANGRTEAVFFWGEFPIYNEERKAFSPQLSILGRQPAERERISGIDWNEI